VRARHNELQQIEKSIVELAHMFEDLNALVVEQDPIIAGIEQQVQTVNDNLDKGNEQVKVATKHALLRRRWKWFCALVVFLIVLAIALGVGLGVALTKNATSSKSP
jgi:syntaxin 1B/2/3